MVEKVFYLIEKSGAFRTCKMIIVIEKGGIATNA